ncbi:MAG: hypothetical protein WAP23_03950 [Candidatus Spechtbacterales bacterium]
MVKFFWDVKHGRSHAEKTSQPERLCLIGDALETQERFLKLKMIGGPPNDEYQFLMFVEHDKVYVATQSDREKMRKLGDNARIFRPNMDRPPVDFHILSENRGGSITYHGPGQLVCYMILCMDEVGIQTPHHLAEIVDQTIREFLLGIDITGYTTDELCNFTDPDLREQLTSRGLLHTDEQGGNKLLMSAQGIWVADGQKKLKKIASRGFRVVNQKYSGSRIKRFTKFGFSINLSTDLEYFKYIYPCGEDIEMTSVHAIKGDSPTIHMATPMVAQAFIKTIRKLTGNESHELI